VEDKSEPKLNAGSSGGDGPRGKTRVGTNMPGDSGGPKQIRIDTCLTVEELASKMGLPETTLIRQLFEDFGAARTVHQIVELDLALQIAIALGYKPI
jgi:Translation initiation factor IF-2, N-terminal region